MEAWRTWSQNMSIDRSRVSSMDSAREGREGKEERRSSSVVVPQHHQHQQSQPQPQPQQPQQQQTQQHQPQPVQKKRTTDPFYGHERTAVMSGRFVSI